MFGCFGMNKLLVLAKISNLPNEDKEFINKIIDDWKLKNPNKNIPVDEWNNICDNLDSKFDILKVKPIHPLGTIIGI